MFRRKKTKPSQTSEDACAGKRGDCYTAFERDCADLIVVVFKPFGWLITKE